MAYSTETIAAALKEARARKGLSQRALSKLSGVPQAHISKIEQNAVDLRLTSLLAIAHALDLELTLVPKKALPAVRSISRTTSSDAFSETSKEWARTLQAVRRIHEATKLPELEKLRDQINGMSQLVSASVEPEILRNFRKTVEAIQTATGAKAVQDALSQATRIHNLLVRLPDTRAVTPPRPAYRLDEDDDA